MMTAVPIAGILCLTTMGADLSKNAAGVPWVDTTDEWGRPWADAASDFYGRLDKQRRLLADQGVPAERMEFAVGTELSLRKVFRPKLWFKGDLSGSVHLEAARGESEAFQLVICPLAEGERALTHLSDEKEQGHAALAEKSVEIRAIELSPLRQEGGDFEIGAEHCSLYRVGYIRTVPAQYPVLHVGEWPDPLLPLKDPFQISNPHCQPVWVEMRVPRDAPAGTYRGQVTVKGPHDVRVDIRLVVRSFALPEGPPMVSMGWALNAWFTRDGVDALLAKLKVLLDHRLAPWHPDEQ